MNEDITSQDVVKAVCRDIAAQFHDLDEIAQSRVCQWLMFGQNTIIRQVAAMYALARKGVIKHDEAMKSLRESVNWDRAMVDLCLAAYGYRSVYLLKEK